MLKCESLVDKGTCIMRVCLGQLLGVRSVWFSCTGRHETDIFYKELTKYHRKHRVYCSVQAELLKKWRATQTTEMKLEESSTNLT